MDMETGTPEPLGTPLLLRLERLEHQVAAWEEGQALPLISPSSNVTGETMWSEPSTPGSLERRCRPARSALEEVEEKGTVLERVSVLEQRVSLVSRTLFSGRELLLSSPSPAHVDGEAGSPGAAREDATLASNPAGEPVPTPQKLGKLPQQEHAPPASDILKPERPEKGQQKEPEDLTVASHPTQAPTIASNPGVRPKEQENREKEKKEQEQGKKEQEQGKKEQEQGKKEQEQGKKEQEQGKKEQEQEKKEQEQEKKEQEQEKKEKDKREQEKREEEKRKQETEKKEQEKRYQEMKSAVEERKLAKARPWSKRLRKYLGGGCVSHDSFLNRSAAEQTGTRAH